MTKPLEKNNLMRKQKKKLKIAIATIGKSNEHFGRILNLEKFKKRMAFFYLHRLESIICGTK